MDRKSFPYYYDIVGSFLRTEALKAAKRQYNNGDMSAVKLMRIENQAVRELVRKQKEAGLKAVTDGELHRRWWHLDFLWYLNGIEKRKYKTRPEIFREEETKPETLVICNKISFGHHPFLNHFRYLKSAAGKTAAKMTIPSPAMLHLICCVHPETYEPIPIYRNEKNLFEDIIRAYRRALKAFYDAGCRYLQFDDISWGEFCSEERRKVYQKRGIRIEDLAERYVWLVNEVLKGRPEDMTIAMHICRGNFHSARIISGSYEFVAEKLFGECQADGFFLEYDTSRAGDFKPLRYIKDQKAVLGLISTRSPEMERDEEIKKKIMDASNYVPLSQLCLSPQCGFASEAEQSFLTEEQQWEKIRIMRRIAEDVWKKPAGA
ncbi:5-methyltetrahydropteroyltriglutamate--homocysteine S-methyltransferase [Anaerostipes sp.]|uniref:5-methyltetrahydropteroyltriglutamate-- homocysteine S-methyltransferase n=1 Tax=Anaerostipes sp. TaxID=1872530 RepID=UPI0025C6C796|nr:5-methyltetrahydropteroyltriglutamate--homocysteine S-methyltransferase [Anaerostipes sp.]MBS7007578.1 5-methyltetrahydropteroyltriglutamate--homocysteine S-methyltransferase [Anaerostipes sp.]